MTPPGANVLDGRFAAIGYVTSNADALSRTRYGDTVVAVKVKSGADSLVLPQHG